MVFMETGENAMSPGDACTFEAVAQRGTKRTFILWLKYYGRSLMPPCIPSK